MNFFQNNTVMLTYTHNCTGLIKILCVTSSHTIVNLRSIEIKGVISLEIKTKFQVFFNNLISKMLIQQQCLLWEICFFL